jgi:pimeloyl-ACP methyl ester carboxylesterase
MTQKYVRLIGEAGQGPVIVILRGGDRPSKAAAVLANNFRVLSYSIDGKAAVADVASELAAALGTQNVAEAAIIADAGAAATAMAFAVAHPALAQSVALMSPSGSVGDASNLKSPAMVLFGTADAARAPDAARTLSRSIPNCRLVYVYDAAGQIDDERPEAVAAALQDFAVRRERYLVNSKSNYLYP